MKRILNALLGCLILSSSVLAQTTSSAFVDVNVVPMDNDQVLTHQTVLVRGHSITALGPVSSINVPADVQRIEGHGTAYLLPGLADMHTHIWDGMDLALYIANGVTTILDMGEAANSVVANANQAIDRGIRIGPHIFFSFMIDGSPKQSRFFVTSPDQGRHAVELAKVNGYDFIKVYNDVSAPAFTAIVDESKRQGMAVIGHGVRAVGLPRALFAGQVMVAHAEEFFYTAFHEQTHEADIPAVVATTARSGAFVTPTLSTIETISKQWGKPEVVTDFLHDQRAKYMSPSMRLYWSYRDYASRTGSIARMVSFLHELTKALQVAGVPLLAGTDSPVIPGMYPGYSIHDELRALIDAGLTPYQALCAATKTPGEFIAKYVPNAEPFGMVKVGMKADLMLVDANPIEHIETLKSPIGVMGAGRWLSATQIQQGLTAARTNYESLLK